MNIFVLGLSHHKTPVEFRERLYFSPDTLETILPALQKESNLDELVVLSTCNRVEFYGSSLMPLTQTIHHLKKLVGNYKNIPMNDFNNELYVHHGSGAVRHLFRVSSSLDSMIVGEAQILGQVKEAYDIAHKSGCSGPILNALFQSSFKVAKHIRTTTDIARGSLSVSSVAVELAEKIFGNLNEKSAMIIGAGETGELTLKHLMEHGIKRILVTNRNFKKAVQVAAKYHGESIAYDQFLNHFNQIDIAISSTSSPDIILHKNELLPIMKERKYKPIFLIDIAVPRDIESDIITLDNVYLYNIDDLVKIVNQNFLNRSKDLERCESIIEKEKTAFTQWLSTLNVTPIIQRLTEKTEFIRMKEIQRLLNQMPELKEEQQHKIESFSKRFSSQFLHTPIENLKNKVASGNGYSYAEVLKDLFELGKNGKYIKEPDSNPENKTHYDNKK